MPMLARVCMVMAAIGMAGAQPARQKPAAKEPGGVAVVELFTSEGCSSCPPADRLLGELAAGARRDGKPVYALAFHVDYWDNLGWKDPFASREFSQRQRDYAQGFPGAGVYTPQMIVNGKTQLVGSDGDAAKRAIREALENPARVNVVATAAPGAPGETDVAAHAEATGSAPDWAQVDFRIALVERGLETSVKRGENAGRTLKHENVVRAFVTERAGGDDHAAKATLKVPEHAPIERCSVIVYAQDRQTRQILGATQAAIAATPKGTAQENVGR
jgi:hypothetical protein